MINKNVQIWRGEKYSPPTNYHIWFKNNKFYAYNGKDWIAVTNQEEISEYVDRIRNELRDEINSLSRDLNGKINSAKVQIVDSVKDLDEQAEIGSIAIVRHQEEYPLSDFQGGSASGMIISAPKSFDLGENQVTFVKYLYFYVYNADFDGNPTTQASMQATLQIGKTPTTSSDAAWGMYGLIHGGSSQTQILFEYDTNGSLIRYNEDTINKFIYSATSTPSGGGGKIIGGIVSKPTEDIITYFGPFVSFKTAIRPLLYTKLSQEWRQYDELVNGSVTLEKLEDKVTTLESKVAELEAKIQELLQS